MNRAFLIAVLPLLALLALWGCDNDTTNVVDGPGSGLGPESCSYRIERGPKIFDLRVSPNTLTLWKATADKGQELLDRNTKHMRSKPRKELIDFIQALQMQGK